MQAISPILPAEQDVATWGVLPWKDNLSREDLLAIRIRQLERRPEDIAVAVAKIKACRLRNRDRFNKNHRLRPKPINSGDWVIVWDATNDTSHSADAKFQRRWFGPYKVIEVHGDYGTYSIAELDGTPKKRQVAGKHVKLFKKRGQEFDFEDVADLDNADKEGSLEEGLSDGDDGVV